MNSHQATAIETKNSPQETKLEPKKNLITPLKEYPPSHILIRPLESKNILIVDYDEKSISVTLKIKSIAELKDLYTITVNQEEFKQQYGESVELISNENPFLIEAKETLEVTSEFKFSNKFFGTKMESPKNQAAISHLGGNDYLHRLHTLTISSDEEASQTHGDMLVIYTEQNNISPPFPIPIYDYKQDKRVITQVHRLGNQQFLVKSGYFSETIRYEGRDWTSPISALETYDLWKKSNDQYTKQQSWRIEWDKLEVKNENSFSSLDNFFTRNFSVRHTISHHIIASISDTEFLLGVTEGKSKLNFKNEITNSYLYKINIATHTVEEIPIPPIRNFACFRIPDLEEILILHEKYRPTSLFVLNTREMMLFQFDIASLSLGYEWENIKYLKNDLFILPVKPTVNVPGYSSVIEFSFIKDYRNARKEFQEVIKNEIAEALDNNYINDLGKIIVDYLDADIKSENSLTEQVSKNYAGFFNKFTVAKNQPKLKFIELTAHSTTVHTTLDQNVGASGVRPSAI